MARDGTARGSNIKVNAGRKSKALAEKVATGNPGGRKLKVIDLPDGTELDGTDIPEPSSYIKSKQKAVGEFEAEFQKSPLNQKYMDLFTEIATKGAKANAAKGAAAGAIESAIDQAVNNVVPTRAAIHQKAYDAARDVPVLGDAIDIAEKASYLGHFGKLFKKKK